LFEFTIGKTFWCEGREWLCTDIGTRTVAAICLEDKDMVESSPGPQRIHRTVHLSRAEAEAQSWFAGPPYAVPESVFDEYDLPACSLVPEIN
jgi:hypothetical protein